MAIIRVAKMSDKQVVRLIDALQSEHEFSSVTVRFGTIKQAYDPKQLAPMVKGKDLQAISGFDAGQSAPHIVVRFRRGVGGNEKTIDAPERQASPYFDEILADTPAASGASAQASASDLVGVLRTISKCIEPILPSPASEEAGTGAMDLLKLQFSQLNEQLREFSDRTAKRRDELEDEYTEKRRELEDNISANNEALRVKSAALEAEFSERVAALEAREKSLDDRDHIHARRELRTHITDAIAEQLKGDLIPRKVSAISWAVLGLLLVGAIGLGGVSAWSLLEFSRLTYLASLTSTADDLASQVAIARAQIEAGGHWLVLARAFLTGAASLGFLLYAISWLKALYHDEVRTRRDLQRYATDLSRASWAVETIMEAKSSGDVTIPDLIVAGVSRNLFESQSAGKSTHEAGANALAELLRTSAKAKFGPQGAEFELTGRGTSRLAEKIDP